MAGGMCITPGGLVLIYLHSEIMLKFELMDLTLDREGALPFRSGAWSKVIMTVCLFILASTRQVQLMTMQHQNAPNFTA